MANQTWLVAMKCRSIGLRSPFSFGELRPNGEPSGGASMLTAQSAPWFRFELHRRVPATAFRPMPSVDGGLFTIERRERPLVAAGERHGYQRFVADVFQGSGPSLVQRLARSSAGIGTGAARAWLRRNELSPQTPPGRIAPEQWAELWRLAR